MRLPSVLFYGLKTNNVEDVRRKIEDTLGIKFKVSKNNDAGTHYETKSKEPVPTLELFPNNDEDEDGPYHPMEDFKEYPTILTVTEYEKTPNIMERIAGIAGLNAELLDRLEEREVSIDDVDED